MLGNKGGVGVALTYMNHTRLLFVNAHFAAHDHKVTQRQADYLRIKAGLFNTKEEPGGLSWLQIACGLLHRLDCVNSMLPGCLPLFGCLPLNTFPKTSWCVPQAASSIMVETHELVFLLVALTCEKCVSSFCTL